MGERFEQSTVGQVLLTLLMAVLAAAVLVWNLPAGRPREALQPAAGAVVLPVGLDQDWALFAPDPRGFSVGVRANVSYADGRVRVVTPPHNGHLLAPYRTYRWQKYVERLRADDYALLWEPTARWIADAEGPGVTRVELVRTFRDAQIPGTAGPRKKQGEYSFYTLDLP
ncbi:MAG: hypothetical protein LC789_05320 [Actinobacteria bacterium]|nr:hypothetical protein [Actinomycetota bacterium]MCA1721973.1 hypothetical protein [Actinomycetota bacterium]